MNDQSSANFVQNFQVPTSELHFEAQNELSTKLQEKLKRSGLLRKAADNDDVKFKTILDHLTE